MTTQDQAARRLRGRIALALSIKYSLRVAVAVTFAWGLAVLVARVAGGFGAGVDRWQLGIAAMAGAAALLATIAGAVAFTQRPALSTVRATLDRRAMAGGLVMASDETDIGPWSSHIRPSAAPDVRYRNPRAWWLMLGALVFVGVAFVLPDRYTRPADAGVLDVSDQTQLIADQIEVLEEERIIESDEAEALRDKLAQIQKNASGSDPVKTFESLDHMSERLDKAAELAAEQATGSTQELTEAQALAEAMRDGALDEMSPQEAAEAMGQLADMLQQAAANNSMFADAMDDKTLEAIKAGAKPEAHFKLDVKRAQQLAEMAEELAALKDKLEGQDPSQINPMDAAKMAAMMKKLEKLSEEDLEKLEALARAGEQLAALGVDAMAEIDIAGVADFYVPDDSVKLADLADPNATGRFAGRLPDSQQFFRGAPPAEGFTIPANALNGEAIALTRDENGKLTIYGYKPSITLDWNKLDELDGDHIIMTGGGEAARVYGPDEGGNFDPQALGGACNLARAVKADQLRAMKRMADAKLITPEQLKNLQESGQLNAQAIADLKAMLQQGNMSAKQCAGMACSQPGTGGINRGRGDAPMTWKDPTTDDGAKFQEQTLPPAAMSQREDAQSLGVSLGAPDVADPASARTGGALTGDEGGQSSAQTQTVLPRHRGAVQRYFGR